MKNRFQSRSQTVPTKEFTCNVDRISQSFRNTPTFTLAGEDGKTILDLTRSQIPNVKVRMRGNAAFIIALNDIRQTDCAGWVPFLNGRVPTLSVDKCITKAHDFVVWVYMPLRMEN